MVNCNPETVSTDYDTSDRLYFEPLTLEDVLEVVHAEQQAGPVAGVIVQLGGQTPLGLAQRLKDAGVPILGTQPEAIHLAEDRGAFGAVLADAGLPAPKHGTASSFDEAADRGRRIGYPVLVRPSYVLGGRGMEIVYDEAALEAYLTKHGRRDRLGRAPGAGRPVPRRRGRDRRRRALRRRGALPRRRDGAHRGGRHPLRRLGLRAAADHAGRGRRGRRSAQSTDGWPRGIGVRGLLNVQYALKDDVLYVLEANPRASRTVPFVSKATAVPLAKAAARIDARRHRSPSCAPRACCRPPATAATCPRTRRSRSRRRCCRSTGSARRRAGVDTVLGPEMRSTGEVMGIDVAFGTAFAKSQAAAYGSLPTNGHGVRLGRQPRQAGDDLPGQAAGRPRLRDPGHRGHRGGAAPQRRAGRGGAQALPARPGGEPTAWSGSWPARSTWSSTPRRGPGQLRARGWTATRSAPPRSRWTSRASPPCRAGGRGAGHRGADPRATSACAPCRSCTPQPDGGSLGEPVDAAGRCRSAGEVLGRRRVGAYHLLELAAGRDRRARPARATSSRVAVGGPDVRAAAAPVVLDLPGQPDGGVLRRHRRVRGRRARRRAPPWLAALRPGDAAGRRRPAGPAVPAARRADRLPAGRRRLRLGPAVRAGRGAAGPGLPGRLRARRRHRGPAVRRAGGQADRRRGRGHHRRRLGRACAAPVTDVLPDVLERTGR